VEYINGRTITITSPSTNSDHMLFLWVMRSDGRTPLFLEGWTRAAECLKGYNRQPECYTADNCVHWSTSNPDYCGAWVDGDTGADLTNVLFYRRADPSRPSYTINADINYSPLWAILVAIDGSFIDMDDPIRSTAGRSMDGVPQSIFPSVYAEANDILLLAASHDTMLPEIKFQAPEGTVTRAHVTGPDETGFVYAGKVLTTGDTGERITPGTGQKGWNLDDLLTVAVRHAP